MNYIGIDIGSTAAKIVVTGDRDLKFTLPTGWSSFETVRQIRARLAAENISVGEAASVSTGYGRGAVDFALREVTEISCHAAGCARLYPDCTVIDVGGQDTKAIHLAGGTVADFIMNDKCSAGTGKFIEVMANRLGCEIGSLFELASRGQILPISSLCTVFAESEIINYIGAGRRREDVAAGVVESVAVKVAQLAEKVPLEDRIVLTGGLSHIAFFAERIGAQLRRRVTMLPDGLYAGAAGAAELAKREAAKLSLTANREGEAAPR